MRHAMRELGDVGVCGVASAPRGRRGYRTGVRPTTSATGGRRYIVLALTIGLLGASAGLAQDKGDKKTTDIQIWAIRATTKNKDISPELKRIAGELKKKFKFTGFKLEKSATGSAEIGKAYTTALIGGYEASITPRENDGKTVKLQVEVLKGKEQKLKTTSTVAAGKFFLQGGWDLDGGDALIVAVSGK
jgi:hypothetical protein